MMIVQRTRTLPLGESRREGAGARCNVPVYVPKTAIQRIENDQVIFLWI